MSVCVCVCVCVCICVCVCVRTRAIAVCAHVRGWMGGRKIDVTGSARSQFFQHRLRRWLTPFVEIFKRIIISAIPLRFVFTFTKGKF